MKNLSILALILLSFCVNAQDMQKYLTDTKELVKHGKFKEALKRDIWFHDHVLEYNQAMTGVRLSFALSDWKALGEQYPPAIKALQNIRDKKTKTLISKGTPIALFEDVAAINRTLGEDGKTVELFKTLSKSYPDIAKTCYHYAQKQLFAAKEYNIIHTYIGSPLTEFDAITQQYNTMNSLAGRAPRNGSALMKAYTDSLLKKHNDNNLVTQSIQLIQYAVAVNDIKSAKEIQQKAELIVKDDRLNAALTK